MNLNKKTVERLVADYAPTSIEQLKKLIAENINISVSRSALHRFIKQNSIVLFSAFIDDTELLKATEEIVRTHGGYYGRKTVKGALTFLGINASQKRIAQCLQVVNPENHLRRATDTHRQMNPRKYRAPFFGYNLHLDQNEKLVDYGCVVVLSIDGHSGFLVSGCVMPVKNNMAIYDHVYCKAVRDYGLWDQIVVDCGREFVLSLFIQDHLQLHRVSADGSPSSRLPYRQIKSTENNRIERIWVEVNQRILYPYKYACLELQQASALDMNNMCHAFTISYLLRVFIPIQLDKFINAWNQHPIPKSGIPADALANKRNYGLPSFYLPDAIHAVEMYLNERPTAQITAQHDFVNDLVAEERREQRNASFGQVLENLVTANIVNTVSNYEFQLFHLR